MRTLILDNEAVQALRDTHHPKHRHVVAHLSGVVQRRRRGSQDAVVVPTAVRVEAAWDRSRPAAAALNRFRTVDHVLDGGAANVAANLTGSLPDISVADAHVGAVIDGLPDEDDIVVLTSDPGDIRRVAGGRVVTPIQV